MKLFCFTYAGGTGEFFNILNPGLDSKIITVCPDYAGHGKRYKEPFYLNFKQLAEDLYQIIVHETIEDAEYALLGYSMGCISVVEVLRIILERKEIVQPKQIFLFAHEPHTKADLFDYDSGEQDDLVKERTIRFGGLSESMINNKVFWRMQLPIFRADYGLIGKYDFEELHFTSDIPVTVFYSETDTPKEDMQGWQRYFTKCELICYTGNHFFIKEHPAEITEVIVNRLISE